MENEEVEVVVIFKVIVIEEMIEKMVEIMDEEVDLVIVVVHEEVIMIVRFRKFDRLKDIYELNLNLFDKNGNSVHRLERRTEGKYR